VTSIPVGINAVRLRSIMERKNVLQDYCRLQKPTGRQTADAAASLGLRQSQFYNLVKAWRLHGTASDIIGAKPFKVRKPRIDQRVVDIIERSIADLGAAATNKNVSRMVMEGCVVEGLKAPSRNAIQERIMKARSANAHDDMGRRTIVFQARFELPVNNRGRISAPHLAGILEMPSGKIAHPHLAIGEPVDPGRPIADLLERDSRAGPGGPILVPVKYLSALAKRFPGRVVARSKQDTASNILGRRLGDQTILHRDHPGADEKLGRKVDGYLNDALMPTEALEVVQNAINLHNDRLDRQAMHHPDRDAM
jgi:hypothetical protein